MELLSIGFAEEPRKKSHMGRRQSHQHHGGPRDHQEVRKTFLEQQVNADALFSSNAHPGQKYCETAAICPVRVGNVFLLRKSFGVWDSDRE